MQHSFSSEHKLADIQEAFHAAFPALRLVFYSSVQEAGQGTAPHTALDADTALENYLPQGKELRLSFSPEQRTRDFEHKLIEALNIGAQLFRRSGSVWLQTSATDEWTLAEQQNEAEKAAAKNTEDE